MGIEVPDGHVWHCSMSLPPEDSTPRRKLTDGQWAESVREAVRRLGFDDGKQSPYRWLAVHHGKSVNGNEHVHLAVNLVREDGSVASIWNDRRKLSRLCAEFEQLHGLRVVEGRGGAGAPGLSRAELERAERHPWREPDRVLLARIVRAAATAAEGEGEFVAFLHSRGVLVRPRYGPGGRDEVVGYSVALASRAAGEPVWFGGGKLDRGLTLPRLREHWRERPVERGQALAYWGQSVEPRGSVPAVPGVPATYEKGSGLGRQGFWRRSGFNSWLSPPMTMRRGRGSRAECRGCCRCGLCPSRARSPVRWRGWPMRSPELPAHATTNGLHVLPIACGG
ncbi:relaxase/mobilization nuclease domain-containing protein [Actinocorallia sp. API 0066]|uniref:relaxase/mobilization nuclease domain-containing protein n=1 Tax=Actinocorallia sp. API 0066 TaxID=2896846 RepID=UPI0035AB9171